MLAMDNKPRLPSITTHFAEYFPSGKASTAPVASPGAFYVQSPPLKRKRSDPVDTAGEVQARPAKQPFSGSSGGWSESSRIYRADIDQTFASPLDSRYGLDSARDSGSSSWTYPKFSFSSPPSIGLERGHEHTRRDDRRPASASTTTPVGISEKSSQYSNSEESYSLQSRLLPPITGIEPAPRQVNEVVWKTSWQREKPLLPPAIEPRTQYEPLSRESRSEAEYHRDQQPIKRPRSSSFDHPTRDIKTPRRRAHEHRYSAEDTLYRHFTDATSPTTVLPRSEGAHRIQTTPSQSASWNRRTSSQHTSPTHNSPTSATHRLESSTRYSWDAPSLYDNMRSIRKRRGNLPKESTALLNDWYNQHASYPYPKEAEKQELQARTGLAMSQISNWFINARRRRRPSASSRTAEGLPRSLAFDFTNRKD